MDSLPDFVKLAEAFGLVGLRAEKPEEVDDKIMEMIETPRAVILDCRVDKTSPLRSAIRDHAAANLTSPPSTPSNTPTSSAMR